MPVLQCAPRGEYDGQLGLTETAGPVFPEESGGVGMRQAGVPSAELGVPSYAAAKRDCGVAYCGVDTCVIRNIGVVKTWYKTCVLYLQDNCWLGLIFVYRVRGI